MNLIAENAGAEDGTLAASLPVMQRGPALYFSLLAVQTAGAAIMLINGVPVYRQMARDFSQHESQPGILWWAVVAAALIQVAYWLRVWLRPPMPRRQHLLLGHIVGFLARLSFILASSTFAVMFLVRFEQLSLSPQRILMVLVLLFSMFCYSLELERLAKALQENEKNHEP